MRSVKDSDIATIKSWYSSRNLEVDTNMFPRIGLIIDGVCACFLYVSLEKFAMIEGLISNPDASPYEVKKGIYKIIKGLTELAEGFGAEYTIGIVKHEGVVKIGKSLGYDDRGTYRILLKGR